MGAPPSPPPDPAPQTLGPVAPQPLRLVYDGGCPFCRHFALSSELRGGIPHLQIVDGRADAALRHALRERGLPLAQGAVLLQGEMAWHGAEAVRQLCALMRPSDPLLQLLVPLFDGPSRSRRLYPLLLAARRLALALKRLPLDPDHA
jgi:hypothetical protein